METEQIFIGKYVVYGSYYGSTFYEIVSESKQFFTDETGTKYNKKTEQMVGSDPYDKKYHVVDEEGKLKIEKQNIVNKEYREIREFVSNKINGVKSLLILRQIKDLIQNNNN